MNQRESLLRGGEWLLYVVMILSFLHMADLAYDAQVQYQQMSDYAEAVNMSVVDLAVDMNLTRYPENKFAGRSLHGRLTTQGLVNVGWLYNKTPQSYITVYNCSCK